MPQSRGAKIEALSRPPSKWYFTTSRPGKVKDALTKKCGEGTIPIRLLEDFVEAKIEQIGKLRKRGLREWFDQRLELYAGKP